MKIAVLGAGKMGLSFSKSFLKYDLVKPENLVLITRSEAHKPEISQMFPGAAVSVFDEVTNLDADLIILSVKPQDFSFLAAHLPFKIPEHTMILSIMAGISIHKIQHILHHTLVARAMPNSPTLLGMGITGYTAAEGTTFSQMKNIERLLNSTGRAVYMEDESQLDAVTALSGSGPAYFYYIVDAMIKAGMKMGIDETLSKLFVKQTMLGSYHLINNSEKSLEQLITDVASKGGTTEAALQTFEEHHLQEIIIQGILDAETRARELNN